MKFDYRAAKYDIVLTDETVAVMPAKGRNALDLGPVAGLRAFPDLAAEIQ